MGYIYEYIHPECGFFYQYFEGIGILGFSEVCKCRESMRSGKWGEPWKELIEEYPDGTASLDNALIYCEACEKYFSRSRKVFHIPKTGCRKKSKASAPSFVLYKLAKHYEAIEKEELKCPDCGGKVTVYEDSREIPCPVCGKPVEGKLSGCWD